MSDNCPNGTVTSNNVVHTQECIDLTNAINAQIHVYKSQWPDSCVHCNGYGGWAVNLEGNDEPNILLASEYCPICIGIGNCPRCGKKLNDPNADYHVCLTCGWEEEGVPGCPKEPWCICSNDGTQHMTIPEAVYRYVAQEFSVTRMHKLLGISIVKVISILKENNVPTRKRAEETRAENLRDGKTINHKVTEQLVEDTIKKFLAGDYKNQTEAGKACGISHQNFSIKLKKYKETLTAHQKKRLL